MIHSTIFLHYIFSFQYSSVNDMNWWLEKDDFTEVERCPDPAGCRYNLS